MLKCTEMKPQPITYRPYQVDTLNAVWDCIEDGFTRIIFLLPTGTGKTVAFAGLTKTLLDADKRVLCLAHRREILIQMQDAITRVCCLRGNEIGIEMAEDRAPIRARVVCGSV